MDLDPELLKVLIDTFVIELDDQSQLITDGLLKLEAGDDADYAATIDAVFRAAHNIKGAARGVDLRNIGDIAHVMEDLFTRFKQDSLTPPSHIIDACFKSIDYMGSIAKASSTGDSYDEQEVSEFIEELHTIEKEFLASLDSPGNSESVQVLDSEDSPVDQKSDSIEDDTKNQSSVQAEAKEKPLEKSTKKKAKKKTEKKSKKGVKASNKVDKEENDKPAKTQADKSETEITDIKPVAEAKPKPASPAVKDKKTESASETIPVSLEKLNHVNALSEELQVTKIAMETHLEILGQFRSQVQGLISVWSQAQTAWHRIDKLNMPVELLQMFSDGPDALSSLNNTTSQLYKNLRTSRNQMGVVSNALQDAVRFMRLVPAANILRPMARSVRDIARELGKKVNLTVQGDDIELDRIVLDGVRAPLMHILRNAIDHGIEDPETRVSRGKEGTGKLLVEVRSQGSQIIMSVKDDGEGIRPEAIGKAALRKQLVTQQELDNMDRAEILDLIFRPGFSSKEVVTDISGRGVGLDVVKEGLRELKGEVRIETEEEKGTEFILQLPLTLATDHGLLVAVGDNQFAIPTTYVVRVMEVSHQEMIHVEGSYAVVHEGKPLPLRDLSAVLELGELDTSTSDSISMVLVSNERDTVAFLVDEIIGERELIIKPFHSPLESVRNISGGAFMGNGDMVMVLNPTDLVNTALGVQSQFKVREALEKIEEEQQQKHLLVVDDSITTRILEQSILENAGYKVTVAVDGRQAWELVQKSDFDLVVSDIEMPFMTGFELAGNIKQADASKDTPVILVSSLAQDEHKKKGLEVGADAYIVKGQFETKALLDAVRRLLDH